MHKTIMLTLSTLLLGTSVALAHGAPGRGFGKRFEQLDEDGDGKVTLSEMKQGAKRYHAKLDADQNGKVTRTEIEQHRATKRAEHEQKRAEHEQKRAERLEKRGKKRAEVAAKRNEKHPMGRHGDEKGHQGKPATERGVGRRG